MRGEMRDKITSNPEAKGHVTTLLLPRSWTDKMILKEVRYIQPHN